MKRYFNKLKIVNPPTRSRTRTVSSSQALRELAALSFLLCVLSAPRAALAADSAANAEPDSARAQSSSPAPAQAIAADLKKAKQSILEADSERRRILGSLYAINRRMKKISRDKNQLTDELLSAQGSAKSTAGQIADLEKEIGEQKIALRRRLRALYELSGQSYVAILFSQNSPLDLDQALRGLKALSDRDHRLIVSYQQNVLNYRRRRIAFKSQVQKLVSLERRIREQEAKLTVEHDAKTRFVSGLDAAQAAQIAKIQALRAKSASSTDDEEKLDAFLRPSFFESKGRLESPVVGKIALPFGARFDEATKVELSHKGWQIAAKQGAPIAAIFEGTIAFSGPLPGLGQAVIVDHGDHYYTVYGYAAKLKIKLGERVRKGQTIGEVGPASWRDGAGAYFEIRHFSDPEDPSLWIRKPSLGVTEASGDSMAIPGRPALRARSNDEKIKAL